MVSEQRILPQDTASICHMHRQIECFTCEIINFLGSYGGGSINYGPFSGGMLPCVENFRVLAKVRAEAAEPEAKQRDRAYL